MTGSQTIKLIFDFSFYLVHAIPFYPMSPSKRILLFCSSISLPLIYAINKFEVELEKHLFNPEEDPTDVKDPRRIDDRGTFLRGIALMPQSCE